MPNLNDFEIFKDQIRHDIIAYFPATWEDAEVRIIKCDKPGESYDGLTVCKPEDARKPNRAMPVVNLNDLHQKYMESKGSFSYFCKLAAYTILENQPKDLNVAEILQDYEHIKPNLFIKVYNENSVAGKNIVNRGLYQKIGDMIIGVYAKVDLGNPKAYGSVLVDDKLLAHFGGVSASTILKDALENSPKLFTTKTLPITDKMPKGIDSTHIISLTTKDISTGAVGMFYPDVLRNVSAAMDKNSFTILPVSTEEFLCLSDVDFDNFKNPEKIPDFEGALKTINEHVAEKNPDAVLSNFAFHYDKTRDVVERFSDYIQYMRDNPDIER